MDRQTEVHKGNFQERFHEPPVKGLKLYLCICKIQKVLRCAGRTSRSRRGIPAAGGGRFLGEPIFPTISIFPDPCPFSWRLTYFQPEITDSFEVLQIEVGKNCQSSAGSRKDCSIYGSWMRILSRKKGFEKVLLGKIRKYISGSCLKFKSRTMGFLITALFLSGLNRMCIL